MSGREAITAAHGSRLATLVGRRLTRSLLVWDEDEDAWFPDAPVLLDFEGEQVEIVHWKFDELSITWNTVDPDRSLKWAAEEFRLSWRSGVPSALAALAGRPLLEVSLLEWAGRDLAYGTVAPAFRFPDGQVTVYNALDENGLEFETPDHRYVRHRLGRDGGGGVRPYGGRR
ncbi:hypothetical protein [Microtetraspora niveoalba]|uniref:hypothetical protein n=1 Tax=Microtetraspora niveoalba TaxID=46175 RepID=UPI001C3F3223|nr:hypothetical protein [Microtetraspora niveoalba]